MSFVLRAALVIGALSYLASTRGGDGALPSAREVAAGLPSLVRTLDGGVTVPHEAPPRGPSALDKTLPLLEKGIPAAWNALSPQARERIAREGLAVLAAAPPPSRDTLAETDRLPHWRGR